MKNEKTIGQKVVGRMSRFGEKLDSVERRIKLPKILTVRTVKLNLRPKSISAEEVVGTPAKSVGDNFARYAFGGLLSQFSCYYQIFRKQSERSGLCVFLFVLLTTLPRTTSSFGTFLRLAATPHRLFESP